MPSGKLDLLSLSCENLFFTMVYFFISPALTINLETSLKSAGGFSNISKLSKDYILWDKFLKQRQLEPFFIPLCFLLTPFSSNISNYYFGLAAIVKIHGLTKCSFSK